MLMTPTEAKLNIRFADKSHIATVPKYVADGSDAGTIQPIRLAWISIGVTIVYECLVITQLVMFPLYGVSATSILL